MTDIEIIEYTLDKYEGGMVDLPEDRGGLTNMGITLPTLGLWLGRRALAAELIALDRPTAIRIYNDLFMVKPKINRIPDEKLKAAVYDFGVHSGPYDAVKLLQRQLGVRVDGILGPKTLASLQARSPEQVRQLLHSFLRGRMQSIAATVARDQRQVRFLGGWLNRVADQYEHLLT